MDKGKLEQLYYKKHLKEWPNQEKSKLVFSHALEDIKKHLSLLKLRLSIYRDAINKEEPKEREIDLNSLVEFEKMIGDLELASDDNKIIQHLVDTTEGYLHLYTDSQGDALFVDFYSFQTE